MNEPQVLQLVPPPRTVPELLAALRAWDPAGMGSWVVGAQAALPMTAEERASWRRGWTASSSCRRSSSGSSR